MATVMNTTVPARPRMKSSARTHLTHSVIYSFNVRKLVHLNLNDDVLRLDGYLDYKVSEYLEDRASEGAALLAKKDDMYCFSDGAVEILSQRDEAINMAALDVETRTLLLAWGER